MLLSASNAALYARPDIVLLPIVDLAPARLVVAWRADDRRSEVLDAGEACLQRAG